MDLLREWADWKGSTPPFILKSDRSVFGFRPRERASVTHYSWLDAYRADDFCAPKDTRLHLGLIPQPFLGNLRQASIYILLLNPGLDPTDYYGEHQVPNYRRALLANLKQRFMRGSLPFLFLDPQYSWHGGFAWWHGKLAQVISCLADTWGVSFAKARDRLARELASIELVPYHSSSSPSGWVRNLQSVTHARDFVHDFVMPRVRSGEAIAIVTRGAKLWNLPKHPGIVCYSNQQARAAHLSPNSRGGKAIIHHLSRLNLR